MIFAVFLVSALLQLATVSRCKLILATRTSNESIKHRPTAFGVHPYGRLINGRLVFVKGVCSADDPSLEPNAFVLARFEDCSIYRQTMLLQTRNAAGLIVINEKDKSFNQSFPEGFEPKHLKIPVIQVDKKTGAKLRRALSRRVTKQSGRPVLRYALRIKRTAQPRIEVVLGATDKPSFDLLLDSPPRLFAEDLQLYFFVEGCNECSAETVKKFCIESRAENMCYRHAYSNLFEVAEAVLLHRLLLDKLGSVQLYAGFVRRLVPSCFSWLDAAEKETRHSLRKCLESTLELPEFETLSKQVQQSVDNQTLFGNAVLAKDKAFLKDKLDRGLLQIWVNGLLLRGQQTARSLETAVCASKLPKPKTCSSVERFSQSLHSLIAPKRSKSRTPRKKKLFKYLLVFLALGTVSWLCLRSLRRLQAAPQHSQVGPDSFEEQGLTGPRRSETESELA